MEFVLSTSAGARQAASAAFVSRFPPDTELVIVGATRGAADDFVRGLTRARATFGFHRFSLVELAARAAACGPGAPRQAGTEAGAEALASRATFEALAAAELPSFGPVASTPGFPKALARTIDELRLAGVPPEVLASGQSARDELARLLARVESQLHDTATNDRAALFHAAADAWRPGLRWFGHPVLLLDVPVPSAAESRFVAAILAGAADALVVSPAGDDATRRAVEPMARRVVALEDDAAPDSDLGRLRRHIFRREPPGERSAGGDVRLFSAPGEGREAVEIARRVLDEAAAGVPFDEIGVAIRSPQLYLGLLEHAFARAGVPAYFDRGTRRPDPAGRAFVSLLSCACEQLSARRFDEYLSLGQVPRLDRSGDLPAVVAADEAYARFAGIAEPRDGEPDGGSAAPSIDSDEQAVVAGTVRAPWKWEELIVESAVVGGLSRADGRERWRRRLDGLASAYRIQLNELRRVEPDSPLIGRVERDLRNLRHLREFALPIIDELAAWPDDATWGGWIARFERLAPRVLSQPARVLRVLADLGPMASVGPVTLEEARDVLRDRWLTLECEPAAHRYGRVFVGTPHQLRGRSFRVVFVPGLAERGFPQRVREDPLLPDEARREAADTLATRSDRTTAERLLLRLAIGAARERVYLSYPRLGAEMGDFRPRVPSFYALDVMRAITGRVPDHRALAAMAAAEADATLSWPAPRDPDRAVDDFEHDLAVLKPLLGARDATLVKGQAHYLLELNPALRRSVVRRWARASRRWSTSDGLIRVAPGTADALERHRLTKRSYSLSALQRYAACPYQFLLSAIHRLEPWGEPQPIVRMDPLTRGSLFHRVQADFFRALQAAGRLPVTAGGVEAALHTVREVLQAVAAEYAEELVPAIERVWRDEVDDIRRDLESWVQRLALESEWVPEYFEYSFGLRDEGRDPRSRKEPVPIVAGASTFSLRGSVDLIERRAGGRGLRVTDHKTGRNRSSPDLVVGGGAVLQPVLYSVAVEAALGEPVQVGRLYYCTTAGGFTGHPIAITPAVRAQGLDVLAIIDRAIELGRLPADPQKDACRWCDFRTVCGPGEGTRVASKQPDDLRADLLALRAMR